MRAADLLDDADAVAPPDAQADLAARGAVQREPASQAAAAFLDEQQTPERSARVREAPSAAALLDEEPPQRGAEQTTQRAPRRGGMRSEVQPFVAEEPAAPAMPTNEQIAGAEEPFAKARLFEQRAAATPRTTAGMAGDVVQAGLRGAMRVAQLPSAIYGLTTGNTDNAANRFFDSGAEASKAFRSDRAKADENALQAKIGAAEGWREKLAVAMFETLQDPGMLLETGVESLPQMLGGAGIGRLVESGTRAAAGALAVRALSGDSAALAKAAVLASRGAQAAPVAGAVGAGAVGQGQEAAAETFREAMKMVVSGDEDFGVPPDPRYVELVQQGVRPAEAHRKIAQQYAQRAGLLSAGISAGAQMLPGGRAIETAFLRKPTQHAARGGVLNAIGDRGVTGVKEGVSEGVEEAGSPFARDVSMGRNINVSDMAVSAGQGAAAGVALGAASGRGLPTPDQRPTERRKAANDRLDDFAAEHGMPAKVVSAIKAEAEKHPLAEVPAFLKRAIASLKKRGLVRGQIDDEAMSALDEPPPPSYYEEPALAEMQPVPDAFTPDEARAPASSRDMGGAPINRAWSQFSPEAGSLNIPREQMPQIKAEHRGALVNFLNARGIAHEFVDADPLDLTPTQAEFSPRRVRQAAEYQGGDRSILASSDGHILDGHHQWLAKVDAGAPIKVIRLNAPIDDLLRLAHQFPSSTTANGLTRTTDGSDVSRAAGIAGDAAPWSADAGRGGGDRGLRQEGSAELVDGALGTAGQGAFGQSTDGVLTARRVDALSTPAAGFAATPLEYGRENTQGQDSREQQSGARAAPAQTGDAAAEGTGQGAQGQSSRLTARVIALAGKHHAATVPLELRTNADGTMTPFMGAAALVDYETQEPMRLAGNMSDLSAKKAIRAARAVDERIIFFKAGASAPPRAPSLPDFLDEEPTQQTTIAGRGEPPANEREAKGRRRQSLRQQLRQAEQRAADERPQKTQGTAQQERVLLSLRSRLAKGGSLTTSIHKAGDALSEEDKRAIIDRARALRSKGKRASEAAKLAVDDHIGTVLPDIVLSESGDDYTSSNERASPRAERPRAPERESAPAGLGAAADGRPGRAETSADDDVRRVASAVPRNPRIRALGIAADLERVGSTALVGRRVADADGLAELAQVYRDPRYETFRVFFVKGNEIVHATGVSSRMPSVAPMIPEGMKPDQYHAWFASTMRSAGADGYYLLHNHPTGNPTPSRADERATAELARTVPGMKAHVVINSGRYAVIEPGQGTRIEAIDIGEDVLLKPSKPSPVLGAVIGAPDALVALGKAMQRDGWLTLIGTDAENRVRVVADVPSTALQRPPAVLAAMVRRLMRQSGSQSMSLVGSDADVATRSVQRGLDEGVLRDAVGTSGRAQSERGAGGIGGSGPLAKAPGRNVDEAPARYDGDDGPPNEPGFREALRRGGNALARYRGMALQALGRRQLVELYEGDIPQLRDYSDLVQRMDADKNDSAATADALVRTWAKLKDEAALARLMHDATLAGVDPATDKPGELRGRFKALSKEAQDVYLQARDAYRDHFKQVERALADRIDRADMSSERRQRLLQHLADNFKDLTEGVYFPLSRFGDYMVIVRNAGGEAISVSRAETINEANALRRSLVQQFKSEAVATVSKVLKDRAFSAKSEGVSTGFLGELYATLEKDGVSASLMDDIGQLYLSSLPDLSWAKHGIHRKKTPGFSQDARRAFASYMFHGASHLAKLRYADPMQAELDAMQKHTNRHGDDAVFDSVRAQQVVDEMVKRHELLMNPRSHPLSTALTSVGFVFHLGLSPASAMVNLAQTPLVAYPLAGAKWGYAPASKELIKASAEIMTFGGTLAESLKGDEADAYREAVRIGLIDVTLAHDLAGVAMGEDAKVHGKLLPVMRVASWLFHHAERINREATFIAAYRLERKTGADTKAAFATAVQFTYDSHFDYSASNRPRVMQGNWQKVIFLFKQFAQNMIFTIARQAQQSLKAAEPAERARARKALAGLLVMHASAAGVLGLPLVGPLLQVASMIGSDDDDPWDAATALRNMLADALGQKPAEVLARGLSRLTPWDISGRVGLDRLILPDVQEGLEGQRAVESWFASALGPVAGIAVNVGKGLKDIGDGHWLRGIEEMMPAALRGPVRAYRYATEGANDRSGVPILDEVDKPAIVGQAFGLSPSAVRNAQEGRSAIFEADRALSHRRSELLADYARAEVGDNEQAIDRAQEAIDRWNDKQPDREIGAKDQRRSVRARERRKDEAERGVYLPKSHRDALEAGRFAQPAPMRDEEEETTEQ